MQPAIVAIKAFGGKNVKVLGSCIIYLHTALKILKVGCQVTDTDGYFLLGREDAKLLGYIDYPSIQPPPECIAIKSVNMVPKQNDTGTSQDNKCAWQQEANIHAQKRTIPMENNPSRAIPIKPDIKWGSTQVTLNGKVHNLPITKEYILREYADIFKGVGKLPGGPYSIRLKQNYTAVQHPPRSVPHRGIQSRITKTCQRRNHSRSA